MMHHDLRTTADLAARTPTVPESILDFARRLGFHPDPAQAALLTTTFRRVILNCSRQWGKSTVTALRAVWHALNFPGSFTLITSSSGHQSGEFVRKAEEFLRLLGIAPRGDGVNRRSILLPNGSRIVGIPSREATSRGFSGVSFLIIDEASRAPEDLYTAVRPMLATTNGDLWLLSTPNGKRGFFYEVWHHGGPNWLRLAVPASECPRISKEFLDEERKYTPENKFLQEYCCEFVLGDGYIFDRDLLEAAVTDQEHAWKDGRPQ